jgi:hypothetical protein
MKLYHGTSSRHLKSILRNGIKPRGLRRGNWGDRYASRPDHVYLTETYAYYYALSATGAKSNPLIIEVDVDRLDEDSLFPDEDSVAQVLSRQTRRPLEEVHRDVVENLDRYRHHAIDSLRWLGTLSHKGRIPASAITRWCVVEQPANARVGMVLGDPSISLLNYSLLADQYKSGLAWLFGDRRDFLLSVGGNSQHVSLMETLQPGYGERVEALFRNRDGITVCHS